MTATPFVDRTGDDDTTWQAELARIEASPACDLAEEVIADLLLRRTRYHVAWRGSRGGSLLSEDFAFLAGWDAALSAMKPAVTR